ncbi:hypothetical protein SNOG_02684 [Parastagonospora nodorum SN15]|uniref:Uncharacterized protein n=1 Tax=Phaeosphaeria nodorum (strain SN15 / ATCC MYA-4574 / FGSC 10173) TaxID=321614 RepID=Q0UZY0_PHANO|nr:hypothetical protein SNOG_02684 [Parastagonospora nodorum SN15]EAT89415.1 hypothetical protein SNOG_02684 [Parastagonospora nodorum SN15]
MLRSVSDRSRQPPNIISQEVTNLILRALKFERRTHKIHYLHRALLAVDLIGSDEYPDAHRITDDSLSVESDDSSEDSDDDGYRSHDRHPPRKPQKYWDVSQSAIVNMSTTTKLKADNAEMVAKSDMQLDKDSKREDRRRHLGD